MVIQVKLRSSRISCGYTTEQAASLCGVSPSTIKKYETNASKLPLYLIIKLSLLYGIPPSSLIGRPNPMIIGIPFLAFLGAHAPF